MALGHACKAAKAFGIIGLLTNVVAIMAVLANFKVIPFFHARARMASIVAVLTTGELARYPFHLPPCLGAGGASPPRSPRLLVNCPLFLLILFFFEMSM